MQNFKAIGQLSVIENLFHSLEDELKKVEDDPELLEKTFYLVKRARLELINVTRLVGESRSWEVSAKESDKLITFIK